MEIEIIDGTTRELNILEGRRIVDIMSIFKQIQNANNHPSFDCNFSYITFIKVKQRRIPIFNSYSRWYN